MFLKSKRHKNAKFLVFVRFRGLIKTAYIKSCKSLKDENVEFVRKRALFVLSIWRRRTEKEVAKQKLKHALKRLLFFGKGCIIYIRQGMGRIQSLRGDR